MVPVHSSTMPRWCSVVAPGSTRWETLVAGRAGDGGAGAPSAGSAALTPIRAVAATAARLPVVRVLERMVVVLLARCRVCERRGYAGGAGRVARPAQTAGAVWTAHGRRSHGLGHARHVEVRDPQRRGGGAGEVVVAPLAAEAELGRRRVREAVQQVDGALVEAVVVDGSGDLAVLDEVDPVAGEAGEQQRLRVDLADVPQAGEQQPALCARDEVLDRAGGAVHAQHQ